MNNFGRTIFNPSSLDDDILEESIIIEAKELQLIQAPKRKAEDQLFDLLAENDEHTHQKCFCKFITQCSEQECEEQSQKSPPFDDVQSRVPSEFMNHGQQENKAQETMIFLKAKRCNCKKSGCTKKYCQCYQAGEPCSPQTCGCNGCKNHQHDQSRQNPKLPQLLKLSCTCKKSQCRKKYCQCFRYGGQCGPSCQCVGCQNKKVPTHDPSSHTRKRRKTSTSLSGAFQ